MIIFVGERRSRTAVERGWTWRSGRLAAKTLHEALRACGVDPTAVGFCNLWPDDERAAAPSRHRRRMLATLPKGARVVALGGKVAAGLEALGVEHVRLIHPAARGRIRGRGRYARHVARELRAAGVISSKQPGPKGR